GTGLRSSATAVSTRAPPTSVPVVSRSPSTSTASATPVVGSSIPAIEAADGPMRGSPASSAVTANTVQMNTTAMMLAQAVGLIAVARSRPVASATTVTTAGWITCNSVAVDSGKQPAGVSQPVDSAARNKYDCST